MQDDLKKAMLDPQSVFKTPQAVLKHAELTHDQKIAILEQWRADAIELQIAEAENMPGGKDFFDEVAAALHELDVWHDDADR